jgi:hypothetical protein
MMCHQLGFDVNMTFFEISIIRFKRVQMFIYTGNEEIKT